MSKPPLTSKDVIGWCQDACLKNVMSERKAYTKPFHLNQLFESDKLNKLRYNVNLFWVNEHDLSHFLCAKCTIGWILFADSYVSTTISVGKYFFLRRFFQCICTHDPDVCIDNRGLWRQVKDLKYIHRLLDPHFQSLLKEKEWCHCERVLVKSNEWPDFDRLTLGTVVVIGACELDTIRIR